jgi:hypothetical protein
LRGVAVAVIPESGPAGLEGLENRKQLFV